MKRAFRSARAVGLFCILAVASGQGQPGRSEEPAAKRPRTDRYGDPLPPGAVARCGTVRLRPIAQRVCCAVSPNGLLATGEPGRLGLWDLRTGKEVQSFALPGVVYVAEICFSADGKQRATANGNTTAYLLDCP